MGWDEHLYEYAYRYLSEQRCVLWGQAFDVQDEKSRAEAAAWLAEQIEGVERAREH